MMENKDKIVKAETDVKKRGENWKGYRKRGRTADERESRLRRW